MTSADELDTIKVLLLMDGPPRSAVGREKRPKKHDLHPRAVGVKQMERNKDEEIISEKTRWLLKVAHHVDAITCYPK